MPYKKIGRYLVTVVTGSMLGFTFALSSAVAQVESQPTDVDSQLFRIIAGADPVVKLIMLLLVGMSIICWAIIAYKYNEMKVAKRNSARFIDLFWRTASLEALVAKSSFPANPFQTIFRKGISDLLKNRRSTKKPSSQVSGNSIRKNVHRASEDEIARTERYIPFLATTGSSAPYIGLLGTVWGILEAFWRIGQAGTSSLAVVGPYIAEALIATALGLAAAIPAVIFYNFFVTRIRTFTRNIDTFSEDLLERIDQEFF